MVSSIIASAPPREVIEAVGANAEVTGNVRVECGYVGATGHRKCGADPTRDIDPRVVDVEEVQGQEAFEPEPVDEEPLVDVPDTPPAEGAAQMEGGEAEVVFQHIFHDIVNDDDQPPAPYLNPLFEGGLEENAPGSEDEVPDHDDFPVAIPEPQNDHHQHQRGQDNDVQPPLAGESSGAVERPISPHQHQRTEPRQQDTGLEYSQQVPAEVQEHGQRLAAALQDLTLGVPRPEPVNVDQLAEGIASALTIGPIPDRDRGNAAERLERLAAQTRGFALQESAARAPLLRAATHAEGLASLVRLHPDANAPTPRPPSHRRSLSDTVPSLDRNLPNLQVWLV